MKWSVPFCFALAIGLGLHSSLTRAYGVIPTWGRFLVVTGALWILWVLLIVAKPWRRDDGTDDLRELYPGGMRPHENRHHRRLRIYRNRRR